MSEIDRNFVVETCVTRTEDGTWFVTGHDGERPRTAVCSEWIEPGTEVRVEDGRAFPVRT